jgi:carboxyl-terminal processing protease
MIYRLLLVLILFYQPGTAQVNINFCNLGKIIFNEINTIHYKQMDMNNAWSEKIWLHYISELDPQGLYLTQSDYLLITSCKDSIDDFLQNSNCLFFHNFFELYKKRILAADSIVKQILKKPLNYNLSDTLTIYKEYQTEYATNRTELIKRWYNFLKYRAMLHIFTGIDSVSLKSKDLSKYFLEKDEETRKNLIKKQERNIAKVLFPPEGFETYMANVFYNTIASSFDPHTSYFSEVDKNTFISDIRTENFTFGFDFEENANGEVEIARLTPGGPAWKSNELNKGDVIIALKWPGGKKVDLTYSDEVEVDEILNSSAANRVELTVRKPNNQLKTVTLIKEKLTAEENLIKSLILKGKKNIGYISLPGFYTDWDEHKTGCANDVAKEIIKLKKENIEGIILDLRFNGGGSMQEAIALAGIFIDEGPICAVHERNFKPMIVKDLNRGTIYDGPLLLLVNNYSASASEILAATLQDYKRAIIVGNPTYGKASSQIILPLNIPKHDPLLPHSFRKSNSFIKVTTRKLYRVTGQSYQNSGVTPDIILPGYLDLGYGENEYENSLTKDSINKKILFTPFSQFPIKEISETNSNKINTNSSFTAIKQYNDSISDYFKNTIKILLSPKSFKNNEFRYYEMVQKMDSLMIVKKPCFVTSNISQNQDYIEIDAYAKELNTILQKKTQNDIYINECYRIISELVDYKNKTDK